VGHQPNFAALNRGHHLYSAGRPSRWALAHILVYCFMMMHIYCFYDDVMIVLALETWHMKGGLFLLSGKDEQRIRSIGCVPG